MALRLARRPGRRVPPRLLYPGTRIRFRRALDPAPRLRGGVLPGVARPAPADRRGTAAGGLMFNWISQVLLLTIVNLRTINERRGWAASAVLGIACVVAVLL